ncbi:MAG: phosphonate ABC transporter ATP-binding protein, partial [Saprospiraceae bacterium]
VILGPSGSGKSTLLRLISGLVPASSGQIMFQGTRLSSRTRRGIQRRLGMVHQDHGLIDRLSVAQNVMAGLAGDLPLWRLMLRLYPAAVKEKACRLLAEVGLNESHANRRARELSGGQRQRVGIARALIGTPALILADEPVASLDPATSHEIITLLRRTAKERGVPVLCSLHQTDLAQKFADRIIVINSGHKTFDGPPGALPGGSATPNSLSVRSVSA